MKIRLLSVLAFGVLWILPVQAQWTTYHGNTLRGRYFVDGDNAIVQGSGNTVHVTSDDGATWTQVTPAWGNNATPVKFLKFGDRYYMYGNTGVNSFVRTTDTMENWEIVPGLEVPNRNESYGLSWMATDGKVLWIRTFSSVDYPNGQIFTSTDGENWTYITDGVGNGGNLFYRGKMYAVAGTTVVVSEDYGLTWNTVADLGEKIREFHAGESGLYAVIRDANFFDSLHMSKDEGATWTHMYELENGDPLAPLPVGKDLIVFSNFKMYLTHDDGQSWQLADPQPERAEYPFADSKHLYVAKTVFGSWIKRIPLSTFNLVATAGETPEELPSRVVLEPNYPNPFNPSTIVSYTVDRAMHVDLKVFDTLGREVAVLVNGLRPAGLSEVTFDAAGLASGVYVYRLETENSVQTRRMVLQK